jgi:hypothetical protein
VEEWRFDLTNPDKGVGVIITASGTTVAMNIGTPLATSVVEAHNDEWKRQLNRDKDVQYWLIERHLGEGQTEVHSLVTGERAMVEQWLRHLTNGVKADMRLRPLVPRAVSIEEMEEVQCLFKEMRQHESDRERYAGLANEARNRLKNLGAPLG